MLERVVSGGQTGVDLAALDAAIEQDIEIGGWCPRGCINETGLIPTKYRPFLKEISETFQSEQENYDARTKANIQDSDGTLIIVPEKQLYQQVQDGTKLTVEEVMRVKKPYFIFDLSKEEAVVECIDWLKKEGILSLNVAGPRESSCPGIYKQTCNVLFELFQQLTNQHRISC